MSTYFMIGKYSHGALKEVSASRTKRAEHLIARYQGTIKNMYVLMGQYDLVLIVDLPNNEDAIKVSTSLTNMTGISFMTCPAVSVSDFDDFAQLEK